MIKKIYEKGLAELPFLGRKEELKFLSAILKSTYEYQGKVLFVIGASGIGKTRLINKFIEDNNLNSITFNASIEPLTSPRILFTEFINSYLSKAKRSIREIAQVIGKDLYDEFADTIPELRFYFPYEPKQNKETIFELKHYLLRFLKNLSNFTPVIFVIENLQNASNDIFDLLHYLFNKITNLPILIVLTSHPKVEITKILDNKSFQGIEKIELKGLTIEEILELNQLLFDNTLEKKFFKWLWYITNGNPLFIEEYYRTFIEKGVIYLDQEKNKWATLPNYERIVVQEGILQTLQIRFKGFNKNEREFLEFASILGDKFDLAFPILNPLKNHIHKFISKGIIKKENNYYTFSHPAIREAIYNNIPQNKKNRMHKKIGDYYKKIGNKFNAVEHFLKANIKNIHMVDMLCNLGLKLENLKEYQHASFLLENSMIMAKQIKAVTKIKLYAIMRHYASLLVKIGQYKKAIEICNEFFEDSKKTKNANKDQVINFYTIIVHALMRNGDYYKALNYADEAINFARKCKLNIYRDLFEMQIYRAFTYKYLGQTEKALRLGLELKHKVKDDASLYHKYQVFNLLGALYNSFQDYKSAIEHRVLALKIAEEIGSPSLIASAQGNLGISYINNCEFKKGEELILKHREFALNYGLIREQIMGYLNLGVCYLYLGYLNQALEEFEKGIELCKECGNEIDILWLLRFYSIALIFTGNDKKAEKYVDEGIEIAQKFKNQTMLFRLLINKGLLFYLQNKSWELKWILNKILQECDKKKPKGWYIFLEGLYAVMTNPKEGTILVEKSLKLIEDEKDYTEYFLFLYFCARYLPNNSLARKYLNACKLIAERYNMSGWLEQLEPKQEKTNEEKVKIFTLGSFVIRTQKKSQLATQLLNSQKLREFLSILIISQINDRPLTRNEIGSLLWPNLSNNQITNNFHVCLNQIRRAIGMKSINFINQTYSLSNIWIDAIEFKNLILNAQNFLGVGKIHTAEEELNKAIELYKGKFLAECYQNLIDETRDRIEFLYRQALFSLAEIYLKKLKFEPAIELGQKILSLDPFDEEGHRLLMRIYLLNSEKAKALLQYEKCCVLFKKEFDCLPSDETRRLYEEIKKS